MRFKLTGIIATTPRRIFVDKHECNGIATATGDKFKIKISEQACKEPALMVETVLHEMCHLWLYVVTTMTQKPMSDRLQERIIEKITRFSLSVLYKELKNYD